MKTKLTVQDLRLGMVVSELDRPWQGTPFLFQGFAISTDEELTQLRSLCQFVFIDTEAPAVAPPATRKPSTTSRSSGSSVPTESVITILPTFDALKKFTSGAPHAPFYKDQVSTEAELPRAREIVGHTRELAFNIMDDVRLGRSLPTANAKSTVADIVESVIRNPDALVCLAQLKKRDEYTVLHSMRVCILALTFGRHLEFNVEELNLLGLGALLHDVGKIKVPDEILNKPGRLTPAEYDIIKTHVPLGVEIVESHSGIPAASIEVVRSHHERFNGAGYMKGLAGDHIGFFASIGAIVDCYDAITSDRVYHAAVSGSDALQIMYAARGKDFHPDLLEQFIQCMGIYPIGSLVELNSGAVGVVVSVNREWRLRPRVALVLMPDKLPYAAPKMVNVMQHDTDLGIRKILPVGTFGVNPLDYLPAAT